MNIILLSGGSGKRLWPLSNDVRSKQFIKMFKNDDGTYESMVQRVYRQIQTVDPSATITVATSKKQVSEIKNQLNEKVDICVEPERRDTFPAIALAAAFLHDEKHLSESEPVVVCPVDPYVDITYFEALQRLSDLAAKGAAQLTLMGIEPVVPSEKYGYIIPEDKAEISRVRTFKEKPDTQTAASYIAQGALWNGGVFAFQLGYLLRRAHELISFTGYEDLRDMYPSLNKISFDYAVVEHESSIQVMRYAGEWKDVGSWSTFTEAMSESVIGRGILDDACTNTRIVNELNLPILCMNCKDMIVAASVDGILVTEKGQSAKIKPYVDLLEQQVMYAEKSWGTYTVLDVQDDSMTVKISLFPGQAMAYHRHACRDEVWTITSGSGFAVIDGEKMQVLVGDTLRMKAGCKHTITAGARGLELIEVQLGREISANDKQKFEWDETSENLH